LPAEASTGGYFWVNTVVNDFIGFLQCYKESLMSEPFIGQITLFAGNFAPRGWAFCQGQILAIAQNTALFSILGTTYGGNGTTTFALPDLRGRVAIQQGQGPGLPPYQLGQVGGEPTVTLTTNQMPMHNHTLNVDPNSGDQITPQGHVLAAEASGAAAVYSAAQPAAAMNPAAIGMAGGNQPHDNMQPYLALNYIIATAGVFPSRN
jgi:microcystin-dependent protein